MLFYGIQSTYCSVVYSERNRADKTRGITCDPWCPEHRVYTLTYKASSEPGVACFFMAHPFIIHHANYKGGWVSGHANQWWEWEKREAHLTLQSILMHHLQHGKWTCIIKGFYKNPLYSNTTPATPGQMMRARRERKRKLAERMDAMDVFDGEDSRLIKNVRHWV